MLWFDPALATGAGFTVIVTCDVLAPPFTDNWNTLSPLYKAVTVVLTAAGVVMVGVLGPDTLVHA